MNFITKLANSKMEQIDYAINAEKYIQKNILNIKQ
jgi:hypothetical protein